MQGPTAVPQIIDALKVLDADDTVDVIVIARGGGSVEDLLPFSDEALCRAVFGCRTPVVSAIGHETDAPLVDYVADAARLHADRRGQAGRARPRRGGRALIELGPAAGWTGRCATCSTASSTGSRRCAPGPSLARPRRCWSTSAPPT